jgi:hypothetical protein
MALYRGYGDNVVLHRADSSSCTGVTTDVSWPSSMMCMATSLRAVPPTKIDLLRS